MTTDNRDALRETPSQTAGPYVHIGCVPSFAGIEGAYPSDPGAQMVGEGALGQRITISGRVFDGTGTPVRDALLEIWQADAQGLFPGHGEFRGRADPAFTGWGRQPTDGETGEYLFRTVRPGRVPWPDGRLQAPHVSFWIVARGINMGLCTRMYFPEEEEANAADPVLGLIEQEVRRRTLIAERLGDGSYRFDIRLQGEDETVFFEF